MGWSLRRCCLGLCFGLLIAGCSDGPPTTAVSGSVRWKGAPLTSGVVRFESQSRGFAAEALLDGQGQFQLQSQHGAGIPLGKYRVAILPPPRPEKRPGETPPPAPEFPVAAEYQDPATSNLTADVTAGVQPFEYDLPK